MTSRRLFQTLSVLFNASKKGSEASRHSLLWDTKKCRETVSALSEETELARVFHFRNDLYHFTWLQRLVMFRISLCFFILSANLFCIFYRCFFRDLCQKMKLWFSLFNTYSKTGLTLMPFLRLASGISITSEVQWKIMCYFNEP